MTLKAADLLGRRAAPQLFRWADRDYLLYALGLGMGAAPREHAELPYVYERHLKIVPTFPTVLAWIAEPTFESLGAHPDFALHSGQSIDIHGIPSADETVAVSGAVVGVSDKGPGRGAVIVMRQEVLRAADSRALATLVTTCFARDAGGCGSAGVPVPAAHPLPSRTPDHRATYDVRPEAALIYRLTGDRNPLHADPQAARAAGFSQPILHGLCTFGMVCRAVLEHIAGFDPARIAHQSARFSSVVYPGDRLEIALWRDADQVSFEAKAAGRGQVAASGRLQLQP